MKILNAIIAALFLAMLGTSSCATMSPAVAEHEEEISQEGNNAEVESTTEKKAEEEQKSRWDADWDRDYWE